MNIEPLEKRDGHHSVGRAGDGWHFRYLLHARLLLVELTGQVAANSIRSLAIAALTEAAGRSCSNLLVDATRSMGRFDTMQIYYFPQMLRDVGLPLRARIGVVFAKPHPDHRFFEVVCQNQCIQAAAFYDRDVALAWFADALKKQGNS